jgi:hypothetical protein
MIKFILGAIAGVLLLCAVSWVWLVKSEEKNW